MSGIKKKIGAAFLGIAGAASMLLALPSTAMAAIGWDPKDMINKAGGDSGVGLKAGSITQESLANWVMGFTTFILGIAIVLFVLKVVLTAVDRMVLGNVDGSGKSTKGNGGFSLANIPIIGAYDYNVEWKTVFIHFGKNVAIVAGAWVLVQIVVSVILFVFGTLTNGVVK